MDALEQNGALALSALPVGEEAVVVRLTGGSRSKLKLCALGVIPGARVVLERRSPTLVFSVGRSRFAVDAALGDSIVVRPSKRHGNDSSI